MKKYFSLTVFLILSTPSFACPKTFPHTLQEIFKKPKKFLNQEITIKGHYQGWSGKCEDSAFLTRSDWILKDDNNCIYVTGTKPKGASPYKPKNQLILVTGKLLKTPNGKLVFQAN